MVISKSLALAILISDGEEVGADDEDELSVQEAAAPELCRDSKDPPLGYVCKYSK
jgi:hypothetical protein